MLAMIYGVLDFPHSINTDSFVFAVEKMLDQQAKVIPCAAKEILEVDVLVLLDYVDTEEHPAHKTITKYLNQKKPLLAIGNGVQTLTEWKLLPGELDTNASQRMLNKEVQLATVNPNSFLTNKIQEQSLQLSVSGNKRAWNLNGSYESLLANEQILFEYAEGTDELVENIADKKVAGLCDSNQQVFGLLFHPERAVDDEIGNTDGRGIFLSMQAFIEHTH